MSLKGQRLRVLVNERLTAAAQEIFALFERTIAEYEEELCRSKEENKRKQQLLDSVLKPQETPLKAGVQLQQTKETETKPFNSCPCLDQENSEHNQIKEEPEDMCIKQEEEEDEYPSVIVKIDDEKEEEKSFMVHQSQTEANKEDWTQCLSSVIDSNDEDCAEKEEIRASSSNKNTETEANGEEVLGKTVKMKNYICSECGKTFAWKATLRRHLTTHSGSTPYTCSVCSKCFPQKSHLVSHMVTHTGERPFGCSECDATFNQKQNLMRHMILHSGEKSYSCSICEKPFSHKHLVQLHMLTHTGEKPFGCSLCNMRFAKKHHLNRHVTCFHNKEKPYSCPICQKCFAQKCNVRKHMKIHLRATAGDANSEALEEASEQELPQD